MSANRWDTRMVWRRGGTGAFAVCVWLFLTMGASGADLGPMLGGYVPGHGMDDGWSVFVGGDFETRDGVAELEGRCFVRGDFLAGSRQHYVIGRAGAGSGVFPSEAVPHLVVGGSVRGSGGLNLVQRKIQVGTNVAPSVSFIDLGGVVTGGVDYAAADRLRAELQAKSRYWGALPDTPGGSIVSRWGGVYITADGVNGNPQTWVFNLTFDITTSFWGVQLDGFEPGDSILINCNKPGSGESFILGGQAYVINGVNQHSPFGAKLLWNFPDAATVEICNSAAVQGSVLIGNPASVTTVSAAVMDGRFASCGSVIHSGFVTSWGGLAGGREFHNYPFTGVLPDVPVGSVSGNVRADADRDRVVSEPDVPLQSMTVSLFSDPNGDGDYSDGVLVRSVQTDAAGRYAFDGVFKGVYVVVLEGLPAGETGSLPVVLEEGENSDNDFLAEVDPAGFFYDAETGLVVTGATVSVEGPCVVLQMDGRMGEFMFLSTNTVAATYAVSVTPPAGYRLDPSRPPQPGPFDPTGLGDPVVLGSGLASGLPMRLADSGAAANPYYLSFELEPGDPLVINNNIPLLRLASVGDLVWEDLDGDGLRDAGEPGLAGVGVRLLDAVGAVLSEAVTATDGSYRFEGLLPGDYRVAFIAPDGYRFTAGDGTDSIADPVSGVSPVVQLGVGTVALAVDAGLYHPGRVRGYVFRDQDGDLIRSGADQPIVGREVRLFVAGAVFATTVTDAEGGYAFTGVSAGQVEIQVARQTDTVCSVPVDEPDASHPGRSRAVLSDDGATVRILLDLVSGYGVLPGRQDQEQNAGFLSNTTLSAAVSVQAYAAAGGGSVIELGTVDEAGHGDIVVYARIGGEWVEVGRVPAEQVVGEGSNRYRVAAPSLEPGKAYAFKVVDEVGRTHVLHERAEVKTLRVRALRPEGGWLAFTFSTEQGRRYRVLGSAALVNGAAWQPVRVQYPKAKGGWSSPTDEPFTAGSGTETTVRIQKGGGCAFFKVELAD